MAVTPWEAAELALVERLVGDGLNSQEISDYLDDKGAVRRTHQAVRRIIQRNGWRAQIAKAPACAPRFNKPLTIKADKALIMADPHVPFHDAAWCNRVIDLALRWGCDTVAVPGDLVDFTAFSKYGRQERVEAEDEIQAARKFLRALARTFATVVFVGGNHEMRLPRITGNALELRDVMDLFIRDANVQASDYFWFELMSGGQRFYIEHPKNASVIPGRVPAKLAEKYHCHVIGTHGHQWGMVRDVSDHYWGIDAGVCCDPLRLAYVQKVHSVRPQVYQGAVIVLNGTPVLLSPQNIAMFESMAA